VLVEIPQASRADLDKAYTGAAKAQTAWGAALPGERAEVMRRAAQVMRARRDEIVSWLIREAGSTRIKATLEWEAVHTGMLEAASLPYLVEGRILAADVPEKKAGSIASLSGWWASSALGTGRSS
jgi:aldehyde dehydrogenase (NAD+)